MPPCLTRYLRLANHLRAHFTRQKSWRKIAANFYQSTRSCTKLNSKNATEGTPTPGLKICWQLGCFIARDAHLLHTLWSTHCHRNPGHRQKRRSYSSETWCCRRGGTGCRCHTPGTQEDKLDRTESTTPLRHCTTNAAAGVQSCPGHRNGNAAAIRVLPTRQVSRKAGAKR